MNLRMKLTKQTCTFLIRAIRTGINNLCPEIEANSFLSFPVCTNCPNAEACNAAIILISQLQLIKENCKE